MTVARAKAPTLAWLLTALTCLLAGMAIVESRHQTVTLPALAPVGAVVTGEGTGQPTATPASTTRPEGAWTLTPLVADAPVPPSTGAGLLRVARLTVPPGVALPPEAAAGPRALLVESGTLSVRIGDEAWGDLGFEVAVTDTALDSGEGLMVAAGLRHAVRNDGPTPAVALVVAIVPSETPGPPRGSELLPS